jgi:hypothetical protein
VLSRTDSNYVFDELKLDKKQITKDNIETELSIWDLISGKGFYRLPAYKTPIDKSFDDVSLFS